MGIREGDQNVVENAMDWCTGARVGARRHCTGGRYKIIALITIRQPLEAHISKLYKDRALVLVQAQGVYAYVH